MPTTMKLIAKNVLGSNTATVTFSSIPQTYTDLLLITSARCSRAVTVSDLAVAFNGSTANFTGRALYGNGSSALSTTSVARYVGTITGANATANTFGSSECYIPNYTGSTNKSFSVSGCNETNATEAYISVIAGLWSNTAAITSIDITEQGGGNLVTGSSFFLYGITKA